MDNITKDVIAAERLGYGPHYGWYKIDYPNTADQEEEPEETKTPSRECRECGKGFAPSRTDQIYCSEECRNSRNVRLHRLRNKEKEKVNLPVGPAICPVCGGSFDRYKKTQQYCSRSCAASSRNMMRRKQKREASSDG